MFVLISVFVIAPRTMRTTALLCALVRLNVLLVAEVFDASARMHTVRQEIRSQVAKRHIQSQSEAQGNSEVDSNQMAKEIFESFQVNAPKTPKKSKKSPSSLTPQQLKRGLISIGVYIKRKEFEDLVHCIDKHQTGEINLTKWQEFFTLTDEELDALHVDLNSEGNLVLMPGVLHGVEIAVDIGTAIVGTATLGVLAPMPQPLANVLPGGKSRTSTPPLIFFFTATRGQLHSCFRCVSDACTDVSQAMETAAQGAGAQTLTAVLPAKQQRNHLRTRIACKHSKTQLMKPLRPSEQNCNGPQSL